jgi:hypothetical protein
MRNTYGLAAFSNYTTALITIVLARNLDWS